MNNEFEFECYEDGRWYVVFPQYMGPHENLEMVEGADRMLDALSPDGRNVTLSICESEWEIDEDCFTLELVAHDEDGGWYNVIDCPSFEGTIWLCNVVHEFFEDHPQILYCSVV